MLYSLLYNAFLLHIPAFYFYQILDYEHFLFKKLSNFLRTVYMTKSHFLLYN